MRYVSVESTFTRKVAKRRNGGAASAGHLSASRSRQFLGVTCPALDGLKA